MRAIVAMLLAGVMLAACQSPEPSTPPEQPAPKAQPAAEVSAPEAVAAPEPAPAVAQPPATPKPTFATRGECVQACMGDYRWCVGDCPALDNACLDTCAETSRSCVKANCTDLP